MKLPRSGGEVGVGVGRAGEGLVGDGSRLRHSVLEKGVHFFTSSSPALHLEHWRKCFSKNTEPGLQEPDFRSPADFHSGLQDKGNEVAV